VKSKERPLSSVPKFIWSLLAIALCMQLFWHQYFIKPSQQIQPLSMPPSENVLRIFSFGDTTTSAKLLALWLQNFDVQQGYFLSYKQINYHALIAWLKLILALDPLTEYPLFSASYLYSSVQDEDKLRRMLDFIYNQTLVDPTRRWRWLAHAAIVAKHRLHDLPLALQYAETVAKHASKDMPDWVQQMHIFILEDMGELERARLEIGGLLASGTLTDPNEILFFQQRLHALEQKSNATDSIQRHE